MLNTLSDIAAAANQVLRQAGFPEHPIDDYRDFVGDGVRNLFIRTLPPEHREDNSLLDRCSLGFHQTYAEAWNVRTEPYPGIPELLDHLADTQLPTAVLSNKPHEFTELCVAEFLSAWPFHCVFGQRADVPLKPDPAAAVEIAGILDLPCDRIAYIGDTCTDMHTAVNAGMYPVGVTWGFRPRKELVDSGAQTVIDHPRELIEFLAG